MTTKLTHSSRAAIAVPTTVFALLLAGCGGDAGSGPGAAAPGATAGQAQAGSAGNSSQGPDLSQLGAIVLGKINEDSTRREMKVTGKLVDFQIKSAKTEVYEGMGAASVVECAGTVVFDGDVKWSWKDSAPKKAGEPANFECSAEYNNQGQGWQLTPPMGIYPL